MYLFGDDPESAARNYRAFTAHLTNLEREEVIAGCVTRETTERPWADGVWAFDISYHIDTYLQEHPRGRCFRPAPRFILATDPVTIRVPDVAFIETGRLITNTWDNICPVVPELVAEVISQSSRWDEVDARIADFLKAGTAVAWILDAMEKRLIVRRRRGTDVVYGFNQKVYSAPVLPRLNVYVYELFGE